MDEVHGVKGSTRADDTVCFPGMRGPSAYSSSLSRLRWLPQRTPAATLGLVVCLKPQPHDNNTETINMHINHDNGLNRHEVCAVISSHVITHSLDHVINFTNRYMLYLSNNTV